MYTVRQTPEFMHWLTGLKDGMTRRRLARRLEKVQRGNLGDVKAVGEGVCEMRESFGPGWRMYYVQRGAVLVLMLGGATKAPSKPTLQRRRPWHGTLRIDHERHPEQHQDDQGF